MSAATEADSAPPPDLLSGIGRRLRPLQIASGVALAMSLGTGFALMGEVAVAQADSEELYGMAARLDAERDWALPEFAPTPARGFDGKLGVVLVNPGGAAVIRYVKCSVVVTVARLEQVDALGVFRGPALAATVEVLSARTLPELMAPGGKEAARRAVRERLAPLFPPGMLLGVSFDEFLIQ